MDGIGCKFLRKKRNCSLRRTEVEVSLDNLSALTGRYLLLLSNFRSLQDKQPQREAAAFFLLFLCGWWQKVLSIGVVYLYPILFVVVRSVFRRGWLVGVPPCAKALMRNRNWSFTCAREGCDLE